MLMKRLACLLLVLAMTCLAAGCRWQKQAERQDWKEIEEKGVLRIGVTECAPFSQKGADGSWSGFDMDLARSVCRQLGLEPEFVELDWSGRVEALNQGEVDCLWSGITARSDLLETLDFTQTYLASRPALVIRWDEVEQYQTAEQLRPALPARALRWHACRTCQWLLWAARRQLWRKSKRGLPRALWWIIWWHRPP